MNSDVTLPPAGSAAGGLFTLVRRVEPLAPQTLVAEAADIIQRPENAGLLCLPVVDGERAVGVVSRHHFTNIFLHRFGRELWGKRPVAEVMNAHPLVLSVETSLEKASQYVADNIGTPISEDFILTQGGHYLGMGVVVDLLAAVQSRISLSAARLSAAYTQLKSSQTALVQSEKMASLGQMVAGVAHEINTPLGYVRNNVEIMQGVFAQLKELVTDFEVLHRMLADESTDEVSLGQQLGKTNTAMADLREGQMLEDADGLFADTLFGADSIRDLVLTLRNFSRVDTAKVPDVNLNDCFEQTLLIANNLLRNKVEVIKRFGDIPAIACSPSQINQVLLNLISNAAQAMEEGDARLLLKTESDARNVYASVQDTGKGIAPEHLSKIFDPFFTTKPIGQGTGLGLSISFQIIQAHGGTIRVASIPGKGSRFVVCLPREPVSHAQGLTE